MTGLVSNPCAEAATMADPKGSRRLIVAGAIAAVALVLVAVFRRPIMDGLNAFQDWVQDAGAIGVIAYGLMYVVATVAFLPGWVLTVGAGLIYGPIKGAILISLSSTLGATLAFLLARHFVRSTIQDKVEGNQAFASIDGAIAQSGWKIILLIRLSPIFPFNLLNYALGLTRIPLAHYVLASWIGMFPGTLLYVYLGSIGSFVSEDRERTTLETVAYVAGLAATLVVTLWVTKIARDALTKKVSAAAPPTQGADSEPDPHG